MNPTKQLFKECVDNTPQQVKQRVEWSFEVADKIADILKQRGMTQREFSQLVGCSESEVCRWVGGTHNFTLATLAKISTVLGVPLITVTK